MSLAYTIRPLRDDDKGYALSAWREGNKSSPGHDRVPWSYYKATTGKELSKLINDPATVLLGAYSEDDKLLAWICLTPGKRVTTVHWLNTRFEYQGDKLRRRGLMLALLDEAGLGARGSRFVYTMRARRAAGTLKDGTKVKSLDEVLVEALQERGITAAYTPLTEWLK